MDQKISKKKWEEIGLNRASLKNSENRKSRRMDGLS